MLARVGLARVTTTTASGLLKNNIYQGLRSLRPFGVTGRVPGLAFSQTPLRSFSEQIKIDKPTYQLTFTCKQCNDRSSHLVSKQAYHHGTVLIQCPSCKNRHLIADHLKVFGDGPKTLEEILKQKGEKITTASLDLDKIGDLEWEPEAEDSDKTKL